MDRVDASWSNSETYTSKELVTARIERWSAQDRVVVLERKLAGLRADLALHDDRLRRLTDELLHEQDRRRDADALARSLSEEISAIRRTSWWRLGRFPRWIRSHIR